MKIKSVNISDLKLYDKNPRLHPDDQIAEIAKLISEFGFKVPILIDSENVIVAGHGRVKAAQQLGMKSVPAIMIDNLTQEQIRAFRIADNKVSEKSGWDEPLLALELTDLKSLNMDLSLIGFDEKEVKSLLKKVDVRDIEYKEKAYEDIYYIIVECQDEKEQEILLKRFLSEGLKCKALIS